MNKLGRNDPCPCGSGKKYKQCCLRAQHAPAASDHTDAVPKAIQWLVTKYGQRLRDALDVGFFGGLDDEEFARLQTLPEEDYAGIMFNAMEWLVADGFMTIKDQEHRVADLLLNRGGPLFSIEQRQWLERLTTIPLRLYEIVALTPGESLSLRDVMLPDRPPDLVWEKSGSQQASLYDLIAARLVPVDDHLELSGAVFAFPRNECWALLEELRDELEEAEPDSALAKEITGVIIPYHWLKLFVSEVAIPQLVDQVTGESVLFVTDHFQVHNWAALARALSGEADIVGSHEQGWSRLFEGPDGLSRESLRIDPGKHPDRLKVIYHTQRYADVGRPWFEALAGKAVAFRSREISDPKGMLANLPADAAKQSTPPTLPPEQLTALIEQKTHQLYANWANEPIPALNDRTPREAITTPEGLAQVKFLLHTYAHNEATLAIDQQRGEISYDFLWHSLGITPE